MFDGTVTAGVGFTVIVNVLGVPGHPFTVGVTVIVALAGAEPVFTAVKPGVLPVPDAASPIDGFEFVHAKEPPAGVLTNAEAGTAAPLQTVIAAGTVVVGVGSTVIV